MTGGRERSLRSRSRRRNLAAFVAVVTVSVVFFLWLLTLSGGLPSPTGAHYDINGIFPTAGAELVPGARVTMAGVQVGTITGVSRVGDGAMIGMRITDGGVVPLPSDSRAQLRSRTPLGENYVEITPGTASSSLSSGGSIPVTQVDESVDVDQVLSIFQGQAQTEARRLIQGIGGAVNGQGAQLNSLLGGVGGALQAGSDVVDRLYNQRTQLSQLVTQLGDVAGGLGRQGSEIENLARGGLQTFRAVAARDRDLGALIRVLPSTLSQVQVTTRKLAAVTDEASPVLSNLATTLNEARPATQDLRPAAAQLNGVVQDLGSASPPLEGTLTSLRSLAPTTAQALPALNQTLCQVNPIIRYVKPYIPDIVSMVTELGSASNSYDAIGHTILLTPTVNQDSIVGLPASASNALQTLLSSGLLAKVNGLTYDPYPAPGQENVTAQGLPRVTGPADVHAASGYVYPHVTAAC
jgi:phospholipid/cholesterol/gamma-HCH transport system substrate-binding protein